MKKQQWLVACLLCVVVFVSVPLLKKVLPSRSRLPFVFEREKQPYSTNRPYTIVKRIILEEADEAHYRLSIEMMGPIKLHDGDRLCIETSWSVDSSWHYKKPYGYMQVIFATGYSYPSQPSLPSGCAGAVIWPDNKQLLLEKVPCTYKGSVISVMLNKNYFNDVPQHWRRQFMSCYVWYRARGRKVSMSDRSSEGLGGDMIVNNYDQVDTFLHWHPNVSYSVDKPTYLPPAVRIKP